MKRGLFRCNVLRSARLDFCATDVFSDTLIDFFFMMFTLVLIIDLVHMLVISGNYSAVGPLSKCSFQCAS